MLVECSESMFNLLDDDSPFQLSIKVSYTWLQPLSLDLRGRDLEETSPPPLHVYASFRVKETARNNIPYLLTVFVHGMCVVKTMLMCNHKRQTFLNANYGLNGSKVQSACRLRALNSKISGPSPLLPRNSASL